MLKPGDFVGPYEIRGFVGQGGMGQVYRAFDPRLERTVALKIILLPEDVRTPADSDSPRPLSTALVGEFSTRLLREARAVASLSHPNVIAIYDVGESDGRLYLAMEYVVGSSLRNFVGNDELPLPRRVRWLVDIARALEAAHKAGIIHRDIKPENVMVRDDGAVKVLDFGIARRTVAGSPDDQAVIDTVTGGGAVAGTPVYMAPEQIRGGTVDARCDQFAWGVMAYELITGKRPWVETGDVLSVVANILIEVPKALRSRTANVPAVVDETILRALAKNPEARFPTMADVGDALEPFASLTTGGDRTRVPPRAQTTDDPAYAATTRVPTTVSLEPGPHPSTPASAPKKWRALSLAAPLVLLGALGAAVYLVRTRPAPTVTTLPPATISAPRPLSSVTEAEAAYKDAMGLWHDGAMAKARAALVNAVALDPTFAAAHLQLALQEASSSDMSAAQASFQNAYTHRHMLVARDERLLEASEPFIRPKPDIEEWETRMTSAVFEYPRDPELQYYLGRAHQQQGDRAASKLAYEAALRLDDGFVPALAARARVEQALGHVEEGLATTETCTKRSPIASTCVETRYELFFASGECRRAKEEATRWGALEPQSARPFASLARALQADGAPRPSVEEVLSRRWSLLPASSRKQDELWERALLAVLGGDFPRADELAVEHDASLPPTADSWDHARPARLRVNTLMEMDRMKEAAKAARAYLDRIEAWPAFPFAPDPSLDFLEPIYRAGEMTKTELDEKRTEWIASERRRTREARITSAPWLTWAAVYGGFAETRDEATQALAHAPTDGGTGSQGLAVDFALGKVYALSARWDDALPYLQRVVSTCETFDAVMIVTKARLLLGQALEAKGDPAGARASYEKVLETWPRTSSSVTVKRAAERLATMTRD